MQPTPVLLPGEFHGQRSLAGYSPWGHRIGPTHTLSFSCIIDFILLSTIVTLLFSVFYT